VWGLIFCAVLKLALRLELGAEYDSNATRAEVVAGASTQDPVVGAAVLRSTARLQLGWRKGPNQLRVSGLIGGKVFLDGAVQDQNTIVGQLGVDEQIRLHPRFSLGVSGDYYDVAQQQVLVCTVRSCDRHRDFRSGSAQLRLVGHADIAQITLSGGYRGFHWKPDASFDFQSAQAQLQVLVRFDVAHGKSELDLAAGYQLERRFYAGLIDRNVCPPGDPIEARCLDVGSAERRDWFHQAGLELTWVGPVLLSAGYALQLTSSNSFGQSLLRGIFTVKLGARLPWQIFVTLKGQLLANKYLDPVLLSREVNSQTLVSIEDENRNAFIADVERPIGKSGVAVEARYSVFTNELSAAPVSFLRHVAYLGVTWRFSR